MKYLQFSNGDQLPMLGLGTWKSKSGEAYDAIREAVRIGYRHIDCAAIYGNEPEIGDALADGITAGDTSRQELWITSKLWNNSHRAVDVEPALKQTLADLKLDFLNLYLIHWPIAFKPGVEFPTSRDDYYSPDQVSISETWHALEACVEKGLVRHIGVSNFSTRKLQSILDDCNVRPAVNQVELHPLLSQGKLKVFCDKNRILLTAYSPLGSRDRAAAFKAKDEPDMFQLEAIKDIAVARGCSPAQVLLAWAVNRGTVVIPKSVSPAHLLSNLESIKIELGDSEMNRIDSLDRHYRFINGSFFAGKNSPHTIGGIWDE